jgi:hypothetical protein
MKHKNKITLNEKEIVELRNLIQCAQNLVEIALLKAHGGAK